MWPPFPFAPLNKKIGRPQRSKEKQNKMPMQLERVLREGVVVVIGTLQQEGFDVHSPICKDYRVERSGREVWSSLHVIRGEAA